MLALVCGLGLSRARKLFHLFLAFRGGWNVLDVGLFLRVPCCDHAPRLLKRELNKQERASDAGMKSSAMGVIPFKVNDDLRAQLQTFGSGEGSSDWIEMVSPHPLSHHNDTPCRCFG